MQAQQERLQRLVAELELQTTDLLESSTPHIHEPFYTKFSIANDLRRSFITRTPAYHLPGLGHNHSPIPRLIHRLWISRENDPLLPPEAYLNRIARQIDSFSPDYKFVMWCNSDLLQEKLSRSLP